MRCSNCGWPNEEGSTRCVKCNSELRVQDSLEQFGSSSVVTGEGRYFSDEQHCDVCGYPVTSGMTRCPACNAQLHTSSPAPAYGRETISVPPPVPQPQIPHEAHMSPCSALRDTPEPPVAEASVSEKRCAVVPTSADELDEEDVVTTVPGLPETYMRGVDVTGTINPWADPMSAPVAPEPAFRLEKITWPQENPAPALEFRGDETVLNRDNTDPGNNSITSRGQARIFQKDGRWMIENLSRQNTTLIRVDRETPLHDGDVIVMGNRMFVFHS